MPFGRATVSWLVLMLTFISIIILIRMEHIVNLMRLFCILAVLSQGCIGLYIVDPHEQGNNSRDGNNRRESQITQIGDIAITYKDSK